MVRGYKRPYAKWYKKRKASEDDLKAIKEYYGYSDAKAFQALQILNDAQITEIRRKTYKGD